MLRSIVHAATTVTALGFLGHTRYRFSSSSPQSAAFAAPACAGNPTNPEPEPPFVAHTTLSADALRAMYGCDLAHGGRVIVVGDVHGCCDELRDLLAEVKWQQGRDVVILLGDLVNKGPASVEVVRLARHLGLLALRGNHDDSALMAYVARNRAAEDSSSEAACANEESDDSKYLGASSRWAWVDGMSREDVAWLQSLPYTIRLPDLEPSVLLVHAGFIPGLPPEEHSYRDLTTMRNVEEVAVEKEEGKQAGAAGSSAPLGSTGQRALTRLFRATENRTSTAWATLWQGPEVVYFGHDAKRRLQDEPYAKGLDTGCVYGGRLTAAVLPGGALVSVPARQVYSSVSK